MDSEKTFDELVQYFKDKRTNIIKLDSELRKEAELYRAQIKAAFGITDNEQANVLDTIIAIRKVLGMK